MSAPVLLNLSNELSGKETSISFSKKLAVV